MVRRSRGSQSSWFTDQYVRTQERRSALERALCWPVLCIRCHGEVQKAGRAHLHVHRMWPQVQHCHQRSPAHPSEARCECVEGEACAGLVCYQFKEKRHISNTNHALLFRRTIETLEQLLKVRRTLPSRRLRCGRAKCRHWLCRGPLVLTAGVCVAVAEGCQEGGGTGQGARSSCLHG